MSYFVTGASGFVGQKVVEHLAKHHSVKALVRRPTVNLPAGVISVVGDLVDVDSSDSNALNEVDTVVHCAARAHIMKDEVAEPLAEYRRINVGGTLNLARQAAAAGVKRFIFISSIKVNGEQSPTGRPFQADDTPAPEDAYGISKYEAEQGLHELATESGMEVVIIRPPLVYGPGVKGNFASMAKQVARGFPLPLGSVKNLRSLVSLDNLVDLIITCIHHPAAANQVFLAGDGRDLSTTELLKVVARAKSVPSRLLPVPSPILTFFATLIGKKAIADRLFGSLQVDITKTRELLDWTPPVSVEEGLRRCFESDLN